jgi:hypothetical protein
VCCKVGGGDGEDMELKRVSRSITSMPFATITYQMEVEDDEDKAAMHSTQEEYYTQNQGM